MSFHDETGLFEDCDQIDLVKLSSAAPDQTTLENWAGKLNIQPVESNSATMFYFRGDKIKEFRSYFDETALMEQLVGSDD